MQNSLSIFCDRSSPAWLVIRRYFVVMALGNLAWEVLQLPLYTLWHAASLSYLIFAVLHCWIGDLIIASVVMIVGITVAGGSWPHGHYWRVAALTLVLGLGYTIFSEWLNVSVRGSWTYSPLMPRLPFLGTGLSPILQWVTLPLFGFYWVNHYVKRGSL